MPKHAHCARTVRGGSTNLQGDGNQSPLFVRRRAQNCPCYDRSAHRHYRSFRANGTSNAGCSRNCSPGIQQDAHIIYILLPIYFSVIVPVDSMCGTAQSCYSTVAPPPFLSTDTTTVSQSPPYLWPQRHIKRRTTRAIAPGIQHRIYTVFTWYPTPFSREKLRGSPVVYWSFWCKLRYPSFPPCPLFASRRSAPAHTAPWHHTPHSHRCQPRDFTDLGNTTVVNPQ
eukprot:COSAG02_NODE_5408_length_4352_cov_8.493769_3_plen_226_part_00